MTNKLKNAARVFAMAAALVGSASTLHAQTPEKHHSVLKGAAVGAIAGHMTHRRHGGLIGAAVGAEVQHHRNKKAARAVPTKR